MSSGVSLECIEESISHVSFNVEFSISEHGGVGYV